MTPDALARLHAAAFTQSRPWGPTEFADLLRGRFTHMIGDARSFALFQVIADEAELLTIATHPDHQRQGLARHLMAVWHAQAQNLGAARAFLEVAADNTSAMGLYAACGYMPCGRRRAYYRRRDGSDTDAILMECILNGK